MKILRPHRTSDSAADERRLNLMLWNSTATQPRPVVVPNPPLSPVATAGVGSASVAFSAPSNTGGSAILDYTATSSPGGFSTTGAGSPLVVTGLSAGTPYTFTVTARNTIGSGAASVVSNSVTPT